MGMNPEIKARWIAALRGGEYQQGQNQLTHASYGDERRRHCCLGVLCDLAVNDGESNIVSVVDEYSVSYKAAGDDFAEKHYLPFEVAKWAGIEFDPQEDDEIRGYFGPADSYPRASLATENDRGASFAEIADLIEQYF